MHCLISNKLHYIIKAKTLPLWVTIHTAITILLHKCSLEKMKNKLLTINSS